MNETGIMYPWHGIHKRAREYLPEMREELVDTVQWWFHADAGKFRMCEHKIYTDDSRPPRLVVEPPNLNCVTPGSPIVETQDVKAVYELSANRGISLSDALLEHFGTTRLSQHWMEAAASGRKKYAHPQYRTETVKAKSEQKRKKTLKRQLMQES